MAIVKQLNRKTGVTYVYESHSYRDKETKQPRAKRKLIGRLDDETGEIIPTRQKKTVTTGEGGKVDTKSSPEMSRLIEMLKEKDETIKSLRAEISRLNKERSSLAENLEKLAAGLKQQP